MTPRPKIMIFDLDLWVEVMTLYLDFWARVMTLTLGWLMSRRVQEGAGIDVKELTSNYQ